MRFESMLFAGATAVIAAIFWWGGDTPPTTKIETLDPGIEVTRNTLADMSLVMGLQSACIDTTLNGKPDDGACDRLALSRVPLPPARAAHRERATMATGMRRITENFAGPMKPRDRPISRAGSFGNWTVSFITSVRANA